MNREPAKSYDKQDWTKRTGEPMKDHLTIALDYDDTYTRDPELWNAFIRLARRAGHRVIIATHRKKHGLLEREQPIPRHLNVGVDAVVFCNHNLKREVCEKQGYHVDIWIDDQPGTIEKTR